MTASLLLTGCSTSRPPALRWSVSSGSLEDFNVLLVTVDTLRADALGCYGSPSSTPYFDRLAREGVRFESAYAHATTTLPSHASLLTGQYPPAHGVRDNGNFRLRGSATTLAEVLRAEGYRTAGFVGAFVLDARFGLDQGFDLYDDRYGEENGFADFDFVERPAEEVLAAAEAWILGADEGPFFAWVHLFDPHAPYEPPASYRDRHARSPYAGEVMYTDAALGGFLDRLESAGKLERTLVVVTSDHGESLGEHGETTHGAFAYDSTLRVPLILWAPGLLEPFVHSTPVGHVDLTATLVDLLAVPDPGGLEGRSLVASGAPESVYFEALNGFFTQGLAPLRGIIAGSFKYVDLPVPELYDLRDDPGETTNLAAREEARAREMKSALDALVSALGDAVGPKASPVPLDPETERRLRSLGYVGASLPTGKESFSAEDDPKNQIDLIETHRSAMERYAAGATAEAVSLLESVVERRPRAVMAHLNLASIQFTSGGVADSVATLRRAAEIHPDHPWILGRLGAILTEAGAAGEGLPLLEAASKKAPEDVELLNSLGVAHARLGRPAEALALFERILALDPTSASAYNNMGSLHLQSRDYRRARESFERAIELAPGFALAREGLGGVYFETGKPSEAAAAWKEVVRLAPGRFDTLYNLGMILAELGRHQEALPYLERFAAEAPKERYAEDFPRVRERIREIRSR